MVSYPTLTEGALEKMMANSYVNQPILQIMAHKPMDNNRIRCVLSDGVSTSNQGVIVEQSFTQRITSNELDPKFTVVRIDKYIVNQMNTKAQPVMIIQELTVVMPGVQVGQKLGSFAGLTNAQSSKSNGSSLIKNETVMESAVTSEKSVFAPNSTTYHKNIANNETNNYFNDKYRAPNTTASSTTSAAILKNLTPENISPITAITPYYNAWIIRARVTSKGQIKTYSNARGEGKLFSFDVVDKDGEIRITGFNNECDRFYNLIEVDLIYYITRGNVKTANKRFSSLNNEYEISLNSDSVIELCTQAIELPKLRFKFTGIAQLEDVSVSTCVDVIGVIRNVGDCEQLVSKKTNKELKKRDINLIDKTNAEVRLTVWGEYAEQFAANVGDILAAKSVMVGEFKGKTLSNTSGSTLQINPDLPEAHSLKGWYDRDGCNLTNVISLSKAGETGASQSFKYLCQANTDSISGAVMYYSTKAMVMGTGKTDRLFYKACGRNGCLKKVQEEHNGFYHCDKCNVSEPSFEWRMILSVSLADCTGDMWVTMFQEHAEKLIGMSTKDLSYLHENDPNELQNEISKLNFKSFVFRVGSRIEEYNGERRVKSNCYSAAAVDPVDRAKKLIQCIRAWNQ